MSRCARCRKLHSRVKIICNTSIFIGVLLVFIIPLIVLLAATFGLDVLCVTQLEKGLFRAYDMLSEKEAATKDPLIMDFIRHGWSIERPRA